MKVRVTKQFQAVPDGHVHPRLYREGEVVDGYAAKVALEEQWGVAAGVAVASETRDQSPSETRDQSPSETRTQIASETPQPAPAPETAAASPAPLPRPRRARTSRAVPMEDGSRIARGVVVEGEIAERGIAEGWATELKDKGAAPESK